MTRLKHAAAAALTLAIVSGCANTTAPPAYIVTEPTTVAVTTAVAPVPETVPVIAQPASQPAHVDGCWIDLARTIGWPEETLATLARIIWRESRCNPSAHADRPATLDNSRGLLQINAWGTLADAIRRTCRIEPEQLFDPATNLACGLIYWQTMGWRPWGGK